MSSGKAHKTDKPRAHLVQLIKARQAAAVQQQLPQVEDEDKGDKESEETNSKPGANSHLPGGSASSTTATATAAARRSRRAKKRQAENKRVLQSFAAHGHVVKGHAPEANLANKDIAELSHDDCRSVPTLVPSDDAIPDVTDLRSPICCVLGHVDVGKTKLLDKIRRTHLQDKEAGGITQQIGATYLPMSTLRAQTAQLCEELKQPLRARVPGLLVIDTPGHASFNNLRARGSSLCDLAIVVVDLLHGLERQTIESLQLLRQRKTPFVIALNKVDQIYGWKSSASSASSASFSSSSLAPTGPSASEVKGCDADAFVSFRQSLTQQKSDTKAQFDRLTRTVVAQLAEQQFNAALYYENPNAKYYVSMVPTSAMTGEGIPDLLHLVLSLTQTRMMAQLKKKDQVQCNVLEVKHTDGHGMTMDVLLVHGELKEKDTIVVCGLEGAILTTIRALLLPPPNQDCRADHLRYERCSSVQAAIGVKIAATGLEQAVAGAPLLILPSDASAEQVATAKAAVQRDLSSILAQACHTHGVYVQASSLGSLEALMNFLQEMRVPVAAVNIGTVHKRDVMRAASALGCDGATARRPEYASILAFDVKVPSEVAQLARELGVKIFTADIIYHLFDQFTAYVQQLRTERKTEAAHIAVFPCRLQLLGAKAVFNKQEPIIVGVRVLEGVLKCGTPLCIPSRDSIPLGKVTGIRKAEKECTTALPTEEVSIKIEVDSSLAHVRSYAYGRHFDEKDELVSLLTRASIDSLKEHFAEEMTPSNWQLVAALKKVLKIL